MDQRGTQALGFPGQHAGRFAIDAHRHRGFGLGLVDGGIGGGIDDEVGADRLHHCAHLLEPAQVKLRAIDGDDLAAGQGLRQQRRERATDLPVTARDENLHA